VHGASRGEQSYAGRRVLVAGSGVAGAASAEVLLTLGATVVLLDRTETDTVARLAAAGVEVVIAEEPPASVLATIDDVVVSPGFAPHTPSPAPPGTLGCRSTPSPSWPGGSPAPAPPRGWP
jgi:UDP-N-acetylmuramoylalanine--D-glutamate ligase